MNHRKISRKELKAALSEDLDRLLDEVTQAMNSAQPGRIIADSEELVRDANAAFRERLYQKAMDLLQKKTGGFFPLNRKGQDSGKIKDDRRRAI